MRFNDEIHSAHAKGLGQLFDCSALVYFETISRPNCSTKSNINSHRGNILVGRIFTLLLIRSLNGESNAKRR